MTAARSFSWRPGPAARPIHHALPGHPLNGVLRFVRRTRIRRGFPWSPTREAWGFFFAAAPRTVTDGANALFLPVMALDAHVEADAAWAPPLAPGACGWLENGFPEPNDARSVQVPGKKANLRAGPGEGCAVSRDRREIEREITLAELWAAKWRRLEEEALKTASTMGDPEPRRQMLFIAEGYRVLAERTEERRARLVAHAAAIKHGPC